MSSFDYTNASFAVQVRENLEGLSEKILQAIWHHLFLRIDDLRTMDGRPLRILDRGRWNGDAGPDFLQATLRIGDDVLTGDVEIHWRTSEWRRHGHQDDAGYRRVILHAVYEHDAETVPAGLPVLELGRYLSENLADLAAKVRWIYPHERELFCRPYLADVPRQMVLDCIRGNGMERLTMRMERLEEWRGVYRLSWDGLMYLAVMDALGFSKNREPFQKLAMTVPYREVMNAIRGDEHSTALIRTQAILFGAAGLLNEEPTRLENDPGVVPYWARLQSLWQSYRSARPDLQPMTGREWKLFRLRPANFPTLRIAGVCHLLCDERARGLVERFTSVLDGPSLGADLLKAWMGLLCVRAYGYWSDHYWWQDAGRHGRKDLIGRQRAFEIVVNAILPVIRLMARERRWTEAGDALESLYTNEPGIENNAVLRTMRSQLQLGERDGIAMADAQGIIHLHRKCKHYLCGECRIFQQVLDNELWAGQEE